MTPFGLALAACSSVMLVAQAQPLRESLDAVDPRWVGAAVVVDGAVGAAAHFDGDHARIDVGPCPVASDRPFTLRCRLRTQRGGFCTPLMARDGERVGLSLVMGREPGRVSFEAWSWQSVRILSRQRVDDGAWHAIEVGYEPASNCAVLWVDGVLQGHAQLGSGASPSAQLRLGDNIGAHQPFAGDLDEVEVVATCAHAEVFARLVPVLGRDACERALRELRGRVLPKVTPSLAPEAVAGWPARRQQVRAHVADALGLLPPPPSVSLDFEVHGELLRDDVRLQRVSWVGFPGRRATGWLWQPAAPAPGLRPAVLCPHGHWVDGARHPVVQARCAAMARFGWTVLAVDSVHVEHVPSGVNSVGAMTWNNQRAIDLLRARDDVDPGRIAVTGASGGAQQSYYLMALEDRLRAAAPIVMACYLDEILAETSSHCGCNHTPRLAAGTDVPEMCAVFAPRPVLFGSVTGDWTRHFPQQGLPELSALWARLGGPPVRSRHGDEGHNFDRPMREVVYGLLTDVFEPGVDGVAHERRAEPEFVVFTRSELQGLVAACPNAALDAADMAREYLGRRPQVTSLDELAPGLDLVARQCELRWLEEEDGQGWRRGVVVAGDGVPIPIRRQRTDSAGDVFDLIVDPRGAAAASLDPDPAGDRCRVFVDPRPYGEWAPFRSAWQRNGLILGRGEGYQAALDVATVCASLPGDAPVHVVGRGEAGVAVLLAAHLCSRITRVTVSELGPSYAAEPTRLPLCPELLRFRDLPELVATLPPGCVFTRARFAGEMR